MTLSMEKIAFSLKLLSGLFYGQFSIMTSLIHFKCILANYLTVPWIGLLCVTVVFPDHTHLLFVKLRGITTYTFSTIMITITSDIAT